MKAIRSPEVYFWCHDFDQLCKNSKNGVAFLETELS